MPRTIKSLPRRQTTSTSDSGTEVPSFPNANARSKSPSWKVMPFGGPLEAASDDEFQVWANGFGMLWVCEWRIGLLTPTRPLWSAPWAHANRLASTLQAKSWGHHVLIFDTTSKLTIYALSCISTFGDIRVFFCLAQARDLGNCAALTVNQPSFTQHYFDSSHSRSPQELVQWSSYAQNPLFFRLEQLMVTEAVSELLDTWHFQPFNSLSLRRFHGMPPERNSARNGLMADF